jgi:hypothetical protein
MVVSPFCVKPLVSVPDSMTHMAAKKAMARTAQIANAIKLIFIVEHE